MPAWHGQPQKTRYAFTVSGSATVFGAAANNPPVWQNVPHITFFVGITSTFPISGTYQSNNYVTDADFDTIVITKNNVFVQGVNWDGGKFTSNGTGSQTTVTGHILTADDGHNSNVASSPFQIAIIPGAISWTSTPSVSFFENSATPYNLGQNILNYNSSTDEFRITPSYSLPSWLSLTAGPGTGSGNLTPSGTQVDADDIAASPGIKIDVRRSGGAWVSSAAFGVTVEAANTSDWVPLVLSTGLSTDTGKDMPPGASKHLRWDYHAASQTLYVCGGDWSSPFYTSGGGDYNTVMFKYTGNGVWTRDYPHNLGTPLYDCNIGPSGDLQPPPHCEASFSWAGGDKFISADYRTDWNTEGPFPTAWTTGVSRPTIGFATMTLATQPMEYDRVTRTWSKKLTVAHIGQAQGAEMAVFEPTRNLWLRIYQNSRIHATNVTTGAVQTWGVSFPDHPADGRSDSNKLIYRLVIVGTRCFVYNHSLWPYTEGVPASYPTTWPTYIFYFNLSALDSAATIPCFFHASLWATATFPNIPVASEQDMIYVPTENALLIWGESAFTNVGSAALAYQPNVKSNPESYFVDVDTGETRPGPPLPRGRNGAVYRPNNTMYYPPTDEIITHGNVNFREAYTYASSVNSSYPMEENRQYTIYKRGSNLPSWAKLTSEGGSRSLFEWYAIPNTSIRDADPASAPLPIQYNGGFPAACSAKVDAWNSFAFRKRGSFLYSAANGGHGDYSGNEVNVICLNTDTPKWLKVRDATIDAPQNQFYYPDGRPCSRHTYTSTHYVESQDRIFLIGCGSGWGALSILSRKTDGFNIQTGDWDAAATWPDHPNTAGVTPGTIMAQHPETDDVYISVPGSGAFIRFNSAAGTYTTLTGSSSALASEGCATIDPVRSRFVYLCTDHAGPTRNLVRDLATGTVTFVTLSGAGAALIDLGSSFQSNGLVYEPTLDRYLCKSNNHSTRIVSIHPDTWVCTEITTTLAGGSVAPDIPSTGTIYHRFRYIPEMKGVAYMPTGLTTSLMYFMRTS